MEELKKCPICQGEKLKEAVSCKDHTVSGEEFQIVSCLDCGFWFTDPRPEENAIDKYYQSEEYISHSNTSKGLINTLYQWVRNYTVKQKYNLVKKRSDEHSLLDYGSGTGEFLAYCKERGWNCKGLEPDPGAREFSAKEYDLEVGEPDDLFELPTDGYGVITMWHVLEHVHRLHETVKDLKRVLKKNGTLIVAVPNRTSHDALRYGKYWAAYDVPRHLYHFAPQDIRNLFDQHGMEVEKILPMKFDSFYVSMLSEKYQGGVSLKGGWSGLISNLKANQTNNAYSSQMYLIRNKA